MNQLIDYWTLDSAMIDLETMGLSPNAAVVQIGCVVFNKDSGLIGVDQFEVDVDLQSAVKMGAEKDRATVEWWNSIGGGSPFADVVHIVDALGQLSEYLNKYPTVERVWSQGSNFDLAILEWYYHRLRLAPPWDYYQARDTRTVYDFAQERGWEKPPGTKARHTAKADCLLQITCLVSAFRYLRDRE